MNATVARRKLSSHVYFCMLFTVLSFTLLPMIASLAAILSGQTALREIKHQPEQFYGEQAAKIGIYASYLSATIWLCVILSYVFFSFSQTALLV